MINTTNCQPEGKATCFCWTTSRIFLAGRTRTCWCASPDRLQWSHSHHGPWMLRWIQRCWVRTSASQPTHLCGLNGCCWEHFYQATLRGVSWAPTSWRCPCFRASQAQAQFGQMSSTAWSLRPFCNKLQLKNRLQPMLRRCFLLKHGNRHQSGPKPPKRRRKRRVSPLTDPILRRSITSPSSSRRGSSWTSSFLGRWCWPAAQLSPKKMWRMVGDWPKGPQDCAHSACQLWAWNALNLLASKKNFQ